MLAVGIPLIPVTLAFGPTASLNVALTLGPALSGLSGFALARRLVTWWPACFVAGLLVAFSPYALSNLAVAHLDLGLLGLVPLVVLCLEEICLRQRRRPDSAGLLLALVLTAQFFLSSEILVTTVLFSVLGLAVLLGYGLARRRDELARRLPHAARGLAVAVTAGSALLAYPVWFALDGPAHFSGRVWPTLRPGSGGDSFSAMFWHLSRLSPGAEKFFAGYLGSPLASPAYLGPGLLAVSLVAVALFRRDRRLVFFFLIAVLTVVCSLGNRSDWTPWRLLAPLPVFDDVFPGRIVGLTAVACGLILALALEDARRRIGEVVSRARTAEVASAGVLLSLVLAAALVPLVVALAPELPLAVTGLSIPPAFSDDDVEQAGGVLLTFPPPATGGEAMTWQAMDAMSFSLVTGGGPGALLRRAGPERAGQRIITDASSLFATDAEPTAGNVAAVRRALRLWGVTLVVVPLPGEVVPHYNRSPGVRWAIAFFTASIGAPPRLESGAFVWPLGREESAAIVLGRSAFSRCLSGRSLRAVAGCVIRRRGP